MDAIVRHKERRIGGLKNILARRELLLPGYELEFVAETNTPGPYQVFWKVKKGGQMAISKDCNGRRF
ncbi:nucleotide-binding domain-containing protein [Fictibacillus enclensis]|uniref:nucleotide-binding domain-containing protein n=1 Tax=Fictibacillus enclensis TaxID=1017270 RepID=UPI00333D53C9